MTIFNHGFLSRSTAEDHSKGGFALIISLGLMAFIFVLIVGLSSLIRVETQTAAIQLSQQKARQNALLGTAVALGQLQSYAGADQRITAPASAVYPSKDTASATGDIFDFYRARAQTAASQTYLTFPEREAFDGDLRNWWNNNDHQPHWTGVFDSSLRENRAENPAAAPTAMNRQLYGDADNDGTFSGGADFDTTFGEFKRDQLPVWLVSGNERLGFDPVNDSSYPADYWTPDRLVPDPGTDPNQPTAWVVGDVSATQAADSIDGLDGRVKVPMVALEAANGDAVGHYAYWVGDESIKANFSVQSEDPSAFATSSEAYRNFLQVPQRIGWERMSGFAAASLDPFDPIFEKVLSRDEIALTDPALVDNPSGTRGPLPRNFHAITAYSRSLLTDSALGGLKRDLTVFFEGSGSGLSNTDPIADPKLYGANDPRFGSGSGSGFPASTTGIGAWGALKSWHDDTVATASATLPVEEGRAPIIANFRMFLGFTHQNGFIQQHFIPVITLWNPFDAALANTNYSLRWRHNFTIWNFATGVPGVADPTPADLSDGEAVTDASGTTFYVHQLNPLNWYDSSNSSAKVFQTRLGVDPWNASQGSAARRPQYRYSPFDRTPAFATPNLPPSDPGATWVTYTFSGSFEAGQALVFSIDPAGNPIRVNSPADLHSGTTTIPLVNDFDRVFPKSYYFDFAEMVETETDPVASGTIPASGDTVRVHMRLLDSATPDSMSMELSAGGNTLWYSEYMGDPGGWGSGFNRQFSNDPVVSDSFNTWRRLYSLDQWQGAPALFINEEPKDGSTGLRDAPLISMFRGNISPFDIQHTDIYAGNSLSQIQAINYLRAFANYNLSAPSLDLNLNIEGSRNQAGVNNTDNFRAIELIRSQGGAPQFVADYPDWDEALADFSGSSTEGFALLEWRALDSGYLGFEGVSELPLRKAKRANANLLSLGQLQQANPSLYSWQPGFTIGNAEASPYVDRARIAGLESYEVGSANVASQAKHSTYFRAEGEIPNDADNRMVDHSYLLNENLWDRYFLSSITQSGAIPDNLRNGRVRVEDRGVATESELRSFETASAHLRNDGALNVNSTSKEAWKALLTAFRGLEFDGDDRSGPDINGSMPIVRSLDPIDGSIEYTFAGFEALDIGAADSSGGGRNYRKLFTGFRYLTDDMIDALAERIVDEVRLRGPFYSVGDFVNRRLVAPDGAYQSGSTWQQARTGNLSSSVANYAHSYGVDSADYSGTFNDPVEGGYDPLPGLSGINGALQRAINVSGINGGVNTQVAFDGEERVFRLTNADGRVDPTNMGGSDAPLMISSNMAWYLDTEHMTGAPTGEAGQVMSHAPGFVTQADILSMIGPALTARGDTFVIRTYGDAINEVTGETTGKIWLETVVQRIPSPVSAQNPTAALDDEARWRPTDQFGRRFEVVTSRWLTEDEI